MDSLLYFLKYSPSPYHAVDMIKKKLIDKGFLDASQNKIENGGFYYITRNDSSIIFFKVGSKCRNKTTLSIIAAHTDSPCLKIKQTSKKSFKDFLQVGVEPYGGGIWHTWFDRDLGVAGKIVTESKGKLKTNLVNISEPIMRIPTLAIHIKPDIYAKGVEFNKEKHLLPVIGFEEKEKRELAFEKYCLEKKHTKILLSCVNEKVCFEEDEHVVGMDLSLYETTPPCLIGAKKEFISSGRIDNLLMCHCATEALLDGICFDEGISMVCLFDNEEVGSLSYQGAFSNFLEETISRIEAETMFSVKREKSFIISADGAHSVHPNYAEFYEENNSPGIQKGPVIKYKSSQEYSTSVSTAAVLKILFERNKIPYQEFMVRNDTRCGSTIGPSLSSIVGIPCVDMGNPQLSMHSIREMAGVSDFFFCLDLFKQFYSEFNKTVFL